MCRLGSAAPIQTCEQTNCRSVMPTGITTRCATVSQVSASRLVTAWRREYFAAGRWRRDFLDARATAVGKGCCAALWRALHSAAQQPVMK